MRRVSMVCAVCALLPVAASWARPAPTKHEHRRPAAHHYPSLFGGRTLGRVRSASPGGSAVAVRERDRRGGTVRTLSVFVAARTHLRRLVVGVYADGRHGPAALLTSGSLARPRAGTWDTVSVRARGVRAGRRYWIAVLGIGGSLHLRGHGGAGCRSERSAQRRLGRLPRVWRRRGRSLTDRCLVAALVSGHPATRHHRGGSGGSGGGGGGGGGGRGGGGGGYGPGLHVAGNRLVDASGQTIVLRGLDRSGTEYMCTEGYGIFDGPGGNAEFGPMQGWKANTVFIGLNEDCWLGINGAGIHNWAADSGQSYINAIKSEVSAAESHGMYPVIGFFWGDPGNEVPNGNDGNGGGQPPLPDNDHAPLFWEEVANAFKNDPNVIFRLQEEPHPASVNTNQSAWTCWSKGDVQYLPISDRTPPAAPVAVSSLRHCNEKSTNGSLAYPTVGMQSLVNIIRGTGATNVIQVPALAYANMLACTSTGSPLTCGFLAPGTRVIDPLPAPQLMADIDMYPDQGQDCDTLACYNATLAPVMAVMPLDIGEIGPNFSGSPDTQAKVLLDWMDGRSPQGSYYGWAWDTWAHLITSYSGTPAGGWGVDFRAHLG